MSKPLKSSVRSGQQVRTRATSRRPSKSRRPVVVVTAWREGFDKGGFTRLLREVGLTLREAFDATSQLLDGHKVTLRLARDIDSAALRRRIAALNAVVD